MEYSILDTDLYKFTVSYAYMKLFPDAECTFTFCDRNKKPRTKEFFNKFVDLFNEFAKHAYLTHKEYDWLTNSHMIDFIPSYYWEWLSSFRFDPSKVDIYLDDDSILQINVTDKCYKATLYEIPFLFLVNEVNSLTYCGVDPVKTNQELISKIALANGHELKFSEFGTRRRYSQYVQNSIINLINMQSDTCVGTSNVLFAMRYNMRPCGTHPHEWFMFHGAQYGYQSANYMALENWVNVYDGDLGIALTDTYTSDVFFSNFSTKQAKLFDGIRQDSGDELDFTVKALNFYNSKGINPKTKTIVYSNALNFEKAAYIKDRVSDNINASFGIGTNLTCDVWLINGEHVTPENIVMKMSKCRMNENQKWINTIKISDDLGKHMGDSDEFNAACQILKIK
jgi:nicotinate phosphoribosyltransferase